jgi:hypothetical protein
VVKEYVTPVVFEDGFICCEVRDGHGALIRVNPVIRREWDDNTVMLAHDRAQAHWAHLRGEDWDS